MPLPILAVAGGTWITKELWDWWSLDDGSPPPTVQPTPIGLNVNTLAVVSVVSIGGLILYKFVKK